ncbi:MAG: deoxyuridine 5'-triphosphate nucleotidohydrolase [Candidatus Nanohaloarchaea archaeon]|nr:deoxyuridine 5'-triphosphate nucleotidohydrolase [Candidatus Nanohaloarchaea archaeon]
MVLNREELKELIEEENLVEGYPHLETQLTPNGFDLTAAEIRTFDGPGKLDFSNDEREIPGTTPLEPVKKDDSDEYGWWELDPGVYKMVTNEKVKIPKDLAAIAFPRSSLLRMGATIDNGVWDGGFEGVSEFLLNVENPEGVEIKENARVNHIVFVRMEETEEGYDGIYKA